MLQPSDLSRALLGYCKPSASRALFEVGVTVVPLVLLWVLMWLSLGVGYWLTLLLAVPAAAFWCASLSSSMTAGTEPSSATGRRIPGWAGCWAC